MVQILTSLISAITSLFVFIFSFKSIKQDPIYQINQLSNKLNKMLTQNIFIEEYYSHIRFALTKDIIIKKCNLIYSTICKMISFYEVDSKISKIYNAEITKIINLTEEIQTEIENYNKQKNKDFELQENDKIFFNKLNNKLNGYIATFLVENAKLYPNIKFYNRSKSTKPTYEQYKRKRTFINIMKTIGSFLMAVAVGVCINYISKWLGLL